ncbi:MAG: acyl-ACP--UDP-N-acetylglucosamine O-acyltransferase [Pseudomonadota bacterium]
MAKIHSSAVIASTVNIADDVEVGPYSIIHDHVTIDKGCSIGAHTIVHSFTSIGENNRIFDHVVLGGEPQDISYSNDQTHLEIGSNNTIREFVSIHRSTNTKQATTLGDGCYIMCNTHIGHDCQIGDEVILTSYVGLSGHVHIGKKAIVGGSAGVHQFVRIGAYAMVGAFVPVGRDVMPFTLLGRNPVVHYRLNTIGLRRAGITGDRYRELEKAYRLMRSGNQDEIETTTPELKLLMEWLNAPSKRGLHKFAQA